MAILRICLISYFLLLLPIASSPLPGAQPSPCLSHCQDLNRWRLGFGFILHNARISYIIIGFNTNLFYIFIYICIYCLFLLSLFDLMFFPTTLSANKKYES